MEEQPRWLNERYSFANWRLKLFENNWKMEIKRYDLLRENFNYLNEEEKNEINELKLSLENNDNYIEYLEEKKIEEQKLLERKQKALETPSINEEVLGLWDDVLQLNTINLHFFISHIEEYINELKNRTIKNLKFLYYDKYEDGLPDDKFYISYFYCIIANMIKNIDEGYSTINIKKVYTTYMEGKLIEAKEFYEAKKDDKKIEEKDKKNERLKEKRTCECCNIEVSKRHWSRHLSSKIHKDKC
jgi:hypothetical protein